MSGKNEIQESLSSIMLFLRVFKTFELGQVVHICQMLEQQPSLYEQKVLSRMLSQFIFHINQQNKKNHTENEYLGVMIVESLIYNLFRLNNRNQINNSIYSNSIMISSASQIGLNDQSTYSIKHYDGADNSLPSFINFMHDFISDDDLIKKFKQMIERGGRKVAQGMNQNQRYIEILLETAEYILNREGKSQKGQLQYLKQIIPSRNTGISSHYEKKNLKKTIRDVNKIIFSNKLNRIVFLLEEATEKVYFSLLRIYLGQSYHDEIENKKSFRYYSGIDYSGQQMLLNINWIYIESVANKNQLFQTPKNPLFKLIQSYLLNCFMPVFRSFHDVVSKCCKYDTKGMEFYSKCENTITKQLCQFIDLLPQSLLDYLRQIYYIIIKSSLKSNKKQSNQSLHSLALIRVKKLLVYSLLVQPALIEAYYSQGVDLQKYEQVCNLIINLFFKSSLKRYNHLSQSQVECVTNLTKLISKRIDDIILENQNDQYDEFQRILEVKNYILEVPVLNHDYQILWEAINHVEFTPKDEKEFVMHHKEQIGIGQKILMISQAPNLTQNPSLTNINNYGGNIVSPHQSTFSPMMRGKKDSLDFNQSVNGFDNTLEEGIYQSESIEFLTWMTVGGSRDYEAKPYRNRGTSTQKLKQLSKITAFPKQKMRQISKLYDQYERIIL